MALEKVKTKDGYTFIKNGKPVAYINRYGEGSKHGKKWRQWVAVTLGIFGSQSVHESYESAYTWLRKRISDE